MTERAAIDGFDLGRLHDAVLHSIVIDWRAGTVRDRLTCERLFPRRLSLRAEGLTALSCPRAHPWGGSVHVNGATIVPGDPDGARLLAIEMQSGVRRPDPGERLSRDRTVRTWNVSRMRPSRLVWFAVPVTLGALMGLGLVTAVHGYAAAYSYGGAMLIAAVCTLVGVVLLVFGWTRAVGRAFSARRCSSSSVFGAVLGRGRAAPSRAMAPGPLAGHDSGRALTWTQPTWTIRCPWVVPL
jgi:hypothetical protein